MTLLRELLTIIVQALALLFGVFCAGALVGVFVLGLRMTSGW